MNDEYIEVDFYVCGIYRGKRKIGRNSICGRILSEDMTTALQQIKVLQSKLDTIVGTSIIGIELSETTEEAE